MSLITLREILKTASEGNSAIPAFNIDNIDIIHGIMKAAEEENYPVILSIGQAAIKAGNLPALSAVVRDLSQRTSIPLALHLDHGQSIEQVHMALAAGFSSVMIDGSRLSLADNIALTKKVVRLASESKASVEAELGAILGAEDNIGHDDVNPFLVRVEDVEAFQKEVSVDALAVGIGNAHGIYKGRPKLDFRRLTDVSKIADSPLVLHGGSGIPSEMIKQAISLGIRKINVATEIRMAYCQGVIPGASDHDFYQMSSDGMNAVYQVAKDKIRIFKNEP